MLSLEKKVNDSILNKKIIFTEDVFVWLKSTMPHLPTAYVASIPDISEYGQKEDLELYRQWFVMTAKAILSKMPDNGVTLFFQSDIKFQGQWVDKAFLCQLAAHELSTNDLQNNVQPISLMAHKIFCRYPPDTKHFGRPAYSHLLIFSRQKITSPPISSPDVFSSVGHKSWERGMGHYVCEFIWSFLTRVYPVQEVIQLFCGEGALLAYINHFTPELSLIGVEKSPKRSDKARRLYFNPKPQMGPQGRHHYFLLRE